MESTSPAVGGPTREGPSTARPGPRSLRSIRRWLWGAVGGTLLIVAAHRASVDGAATPDLPPPALVGRQAPPIMSSEFTSSGQFELLRGRWAVVTFVATWCGPCRKEQPELVRFAAEHRRTSDVDVVTITYQDDPAALQTFERSHGGTWPVLADPGGDLASSYGVQAVPQSFVIDPSGIVRMNIIGGATMGRLDRAVNQRWRAPQA